jgi:hypothetical protein
MLSPGIAVLTVVRPAPASLLLLPNSPGGYPNSTFVPTPLGRRLMQATGDEGPLIVRCPDGAWTQEPGATSAEQCRE